MFLDGLGRPPVPWACTQQLKRWLIEAWRLPDDAPVMVTELTCAEEGCPPVETLFAVLRPKQPALKLTIKVPATEITQAQVFALERPSELDVP